MKKILIMFVALLTMAAFTGSVMAQGQAKPAAPAATEKQAAPVPEKKEAAPQAMKASGTVSAYETGKMVRIKEKDKEMTFDLTGQTVVKGEVKDGANVTVMYKKDGDKMVATDIAVTAQKKVEEKKPAPAEKKS